MKQSFSRREFAIGAFALTVMFGSARTAAQGAAESLLGKRIPRELLPLMPALPLDVVGIIEAIRALEREADRIELPPSLLTPRGLAAIPRDPERLYELALPRLVALIDRAEMRDTPFADRAGDLLARLHATQRGVPEGLGGPSLSSAPARPIAFAMAEPPPGLPGEGLPRLPPITLPVPEIETPAAQPAEPATPPSVSRSLRFADLNDEYTAMFASAKLRPEHQPSADFHLAVMRKAQPRYASVGKRVGAPWAFIAAIHGLEASFNFRAHLHNGDFPLSRRTRQVPAGRPGVWLPPSDWESSALDAMRVMGFAGQDDWSMPRMLHRLEAYNGFGYRRRALVTPYLWSFSNHYERGKFVADGRYDPRARSQQCGAGVMLRLLADAGEIED